MANVKKITKDTKSKGENSVIPKGSKILGKDTDVTVEEIENGFLIIRRTEVKFSYKLPDGSERTDWSYNTKKYFSKEDPLTINTTDKSLADLFEEE